MEAEFKGKVFYLRDFAQNGEIRISAEGIPVNKTRLGPWTVALMQVTKVEVRNGEVILSGNRLGLLRDATQKLTPMRTGDKINIHVVGDPTSGAWRSYLVADVRELQALVPREYRSFVAGKFDAEEKKNDSLKGQKVGEEEGMDIYRVGLNVKPPRPIATTDPEYSDLSRKHGIRGMTVLRVIISADGKPAKIEVRKPLGMGMDELAIKAVESWKFKPATKDGVPVAVAINVEINFGMFPQ